MSAQITAAADVIVAVAYFAIMTALVVPLARTRQIRANPLGTATAMIFFSCGLGHAVHVSHSLVRVMNSAPVTGRHLFETWVAVFTAAVAVYYWSLRRTYGALMQGAGLFADLAEQRRVGELEHRDALASARAEAERERGAQAAMLESVIASSQSLISVKDLDGRYLMVNRAFERTFGVDEAVVVGRTDDLLDPDMAGAWRTHDLQAQRSHIAVRESARTAAGTRHFESVKFPLRDTAGQVYATCAVALDVTERLRADAEITMARDAAVAATAAKSAFLATMSHEIRTPLNAVIGLSGLLLDTDLDERQRDLVETVNSSGDALLGVLNHVLDFSKVEAGAVQVDRAELDVLACAEASMDVVATAAAAKGVRLVLEVGDRCPATVVGDFALVRQVLVNLLHNAVKFTPAGTVLLSLDASAPANGTVQVCFAVRDEGIGIPLDRLDRLFRSFSQVDASTTRAYGGTGLGLGISRGLASAMGGDLTVNSTPGRGSTFCLSFPVGEAPGSTAVTVPDPVLAGRSVLLVAPDGTSRRVLERQLRGWGLVTAGADSDAAAALVAGGGRYDVVVLDGTADIARAVGTAGRLVDLCPGARLPVVLLRSMAVPAPAGTRPDVTVLAEPAKRAALAAALRSAVLGPGQADHGQAGPALARPGRQPPAAAAAAGPLKPRVLVVEDNAVNQKVARLLLDRLGYRVDIVSDGPRAVAAVSDVPYGVVLMDVYMPGMDGLETTRAIREALPAARQPYVMALTASALVEDRRACAEAGMDGYLVKPFREQELAAALELATFGGTRTSSEAQVGAAAGSALPA